MAKKKVVVTDEQQDQAFLNAYQALCKKYNRTLAPAPVWRYSEDGNDFRLQINFAIKRNAELS